MKILNLFILVFLTNVLSLQGQLACKAEINVAISYDGTAILTPEIILVSPMNPTRRYVLSRTNFNCADVNNTYLVTVYEYEGSRIVNSCTSSILIENKFDTVLPCGIVRAWCASSTIPLDSDGEITLTPDMVAGGSVSPAFNYVIRPSYLDCSNLGVNTVSLTAIGTDGVSSTCDAEITVTNPSSFISPCWRFLVRYFRFFPSNIFINSVAQGTPVPFELKIEKSGEIKKLVNGQLNMVLSKDEILSKDDILLFTKSIKLNQKDKFVDINSKFSIPVNIPNGTYFLMTDMLSNNKKENIGFERQIQKITVSSKSFGNTSPRIKIEQKPIAVLPNPSFDFIYFTGLTQDDVELQIYDALGKVYVKQMVNEFTNSVDISSLNIGVYFAKIIHLDNTSQILKIIKSN